MIARRFRLHRDGDIRRVRSRGKASSHGPLVARVLPSDLPHNRYTVVAGKRVGKAVQRNRLKRLAREALRGYHPWIRPGHDLVFVCRGDVDEMPTLLHAQQALHRIIGRANLWSVAPGRPGGPPDPGSPVTTGWATPLVTAGSVGDDAPLTTGASETTTERPA